MQFSERAFKSFVPEAKEKNYFDIAATLALLIILLIMIYPAVNHILELNQEVTSGRQVNQQLTQKLQDLGTAQSNLNQIKDSLPLANIALPVGTDFKDFLKIPIEKLAGAHNLTMKNLQFNNVPISDPTEDNLKLRDMNFTLTLIGGYVDFAGFLKDLESYIRTTSVTRLDIKKAETEPSPTITLDAKVNYMGSPLTIIPASGGGQ